MDLTLKKISDEYWEITLEENLIRIIVPIIGGHDIMETATMFRELSEKLDPVEDGQDTECHCGHCEQMDRNERGAADNIDHWLKRGR